MTYLNSKKKVQGNHGRWNGSDRDSWRPESDVGGQCGEIRRFRTQIHRLKRGIERPWGDLSIFPNVCLRTDVKVKVSVRNFISFYIHRQRRLFSVLCYFYSSLSCMSSMKYWMSFSCPNFHYFSFYACESESNSKAVKDEDVPMSHSESGLR